MRKLQFVLSLASALGLVAGATQAQNLLTNGTLDDTVATEINPPAPGFFLPKPAVWVNEGTRSTSGPYEDEMSSEAFAGDPPTPDTAEGNGLPGPDGCGENQFDCGVFFKPFSGTLPNTQFPAGNFATGHLYQAVPGTPGLTYTLSGWAGAEPNYSGLIPATITRSEFAIEFDNDNDRSNGFISSVVLDLVADGMTGGPAPARGYGEHSVSGVAPLGTAFVRARASMIDAYGNPAGGGQAFVIDDFSLTAVPEPASMIMLFVGAVGMLGFARRR
jgi:hypothetical protein